MSQAIHHLSNKRFCKSSSSPSSKKARLGGGKSIESLRTLSARVGSSLDATLPFLPDLLPELPPLPNSPNVVSTSDVSLDDDVFLQSLVEDPLLNQTRDGGLPLVDIDIYDVCFADCDDKSAARQVCSIDNSLQTSVAVHNTLAFFVGHSHGLLVCNCHLFCQPGKNICRKCLDSSSGEGNIEDSENEEARAVSEDASAISEGASTISPEIVQKMVNSDVYCDLLERPCSSPKKKGKGNSFVGFDAVMEAWPKLTFNFNNLTQSSAGRDLQLPSIPVVVHVMMKALKYKTKDDAPLRELICSMILSDKVPRQSRFFFSDKVMKKRLKLIGYDRDDDLQKIIMDVSLVMRASMFVLDLFAYAEAFDMLDVVANFFLTDKGCIGSEDAELVHQFASLGYSIEFLTKTLARAFEDCSVSKKGLLIRCTVSDTSVKKCMAGPIMKSFLECLPLVGLYPELGNGSELPHVQEFSACLHSALSLSLIEDKQKRKEVVSYYLDSMLGNRASTSDVIDAMLSNGRVRVLPLFFVAFSCHLSKTALKSSCSAFDVALLGGKAKKEVQSSGGVRLVERTNGELIEDPSFEHFRLKQSMEYETDLSKVLLHCFKMSDMASLFRPPQRERKINFDIRPFSLNFNEAENVTRDVEAMMMKVASNPDLYTSNRRFTETLMKLSVFAAQVISSSGVDAVTTAEDTACMVANSQLSNIQYPIL